MIHDALLGTGHGGIYNRAIMFRDNPAVGFSLDAYDFDPDGFDDVDLHI